MIWSRWTIQYMSPWYLTKGICAGQLQRRVGVKPVRRDQRRKNYTVRFNFRSNSDGPCIINMITPPKHDQFQPFFFPPTIASPFTASSKVSASNFILYEDCSNGLVLCRYRWVYLWIVTDEVGFLGLPSHPWSWLLLCSEFGMIDGLAFLMVSQVLLELSLTHTR